MLRSVTLSVAISVLVAACALVEQPVPAGTTTVQGQVRNRTGHPVEITVKTPTGALHGAVQPGSVPAGLTPDVTLHLPLGQEYALSAGGFDMPGISVDDYGRMGCRFDFEISSDGLGLSCLSTP